MINRVKEWDPLGFGIDFYETEACDVVSVASAFDDADYIAKKIQNIYLVSFEERIAIEKCKALACELLVLKEGGSCEL
ncbi:DUF1871 family protein [Bacillus sp. 165]|nr:DUF1871 family protein [Bacillus sp. 165]